MLLNLPRVHPLLSLCGGYALVMLFNPVRRALLDGFRCIGRYPRVWLTFTFLAFAYFVFQFVFWRLPAWSGLASETGLLQISATVDAVAFIFEYLFGVYIQVYLITVCLAWVKGVSFEEGELFRFAMRRFSYVLKWAGIVVFI